MKKITIVQRHENDNGEFIELTHNGADEGRVYRVEIKLYSAGWDEWWTYRQTELNESLSKERYEDLKQHIDRKVMA
jgi:hypothetical protein